MQGTPFDFFVQWHLTERCNLRCRHCYQGAAVPEMSRGEIRRGIDNIRDAFKSWETEHDVALSPAFHFTGGEPLLSPDLWDVLDYARACGYSTSVMTNGTLVNAAAARRLKEAGVSDVQVSLDGLEEVHDGIRGRGSFRRALEGIANLAASGVEVNINLTLSRLNMGQVAGLLELAGTCGAAALTLSRLVACGRGGALADEALAPAELAALYRDIIGLGAGSRVPVTSRDPLYSVAVLAGDAVPAADFPLGGCAAGVYGITVAADGAVMPCRRMDLAIGNIRDVSFRELWAASPVLWGLRTRGDYHGGCEKCVYWAVCRGCRAVALAHARSLGREDCLGPDPQCPYYREA